MINSTTAPAMSSQVGMPPPGTVEETGRFGFNVIGGNFNAVWLPEDWFADCVALSGWAMAGLGGVEMAGFGGA